MRKQTRESAGTKPTLAEMRADLAHRITAHAPSAGETVLIPFALERSRPCNRAHVFPVQGVTKSVTGLTQLEYRDGLFPALGGPVDLRASRRRCVSPEFICRSWPVLKPTAWATAALHSVSRTVCVVRMLSRYHRPYFVDLWAILLAILLTEAANGATHNKLRRD